MSVLTCSRSGCHEVMCRTYVPSVGYICRECQEEFKYYINSQRDLIADSHDTILRALENFIQTRKGDFGKGTEIDVYDFFKEYTRE